MPFRGALGDEIHQQRPFHSLSEEATLGLFRTADLLKRQHALMLEPQGITLQQYNVLRILRGAGAQGLPTLTIAERMVERTPGITRLIDRLERKQLVQRERGVEDRRRVLCCITPSGLDLLTALDQPMDEVIDDSLKMLSQPEKEHLIDLLDRLRTESSI